MNSTFLEAVAQNVEQRRPELRRIDTEIDTTCKYGFLMPDLSILHLAKPDEMPVCIEIKVRPFIGQEAATHLAHPAISYFHSLNGASCLIHH